MSRICSTCVILVLAAALLMPEPEAKATCLGLNSTFLQLTEAQLTRPTAEWRELFEEFREIGINTVFLQWTVVDRKPLFQTARLEMGSSTPLTSILDLAEQSGVRVWFGLAFDSSYWEEIKQSPGMLRPYLQRRLQDLA